MFNDMLNPFTLAIDIYPNWFRKKKMKNQRSRRDWRGGAYFAYFWTNFLYHTYMYYMLNVLEIYMLRKYV